MGKALAINDVSLPPPPPAACTDTASAALPDPSWCLTQALWQKWDSFVPAAPATYLVVDAIYFRSQPGNEEGAACQCGSHALALLLERTRSPCHAE